MLVQPYGEKIVHLGVKSIKSIKLGTMIVLGGLIIFSYGPHPNTHGGETQCALGGRGLAVLFKSLSIW